MLQHILNHKPSTWTGGSDYSNVRYTLHEVPKGSNEYEEVTAPFVSVMTKVPCKVERVQHPYAFGRYLLRKTQMSLAGKNVTEITAYYHIGKSDLIIALDYNLDTRRRSICYPYYTTEPTFLLSPDYSNLKNPDKVVIVCRCLEGTVQSSDANYYPTYVIHYDQVP